MITKKCGRTKEVSYRGYKFQQIISTKLFTLANYVFSLSKKYPSQRTSRMLLLAARTRLCSILSIARCALIRISTHSQIQNFESSAVHLQLFHCFYLLLEGNCRQLCKSAEGVLFLFFQMVRKKELLLACFSKSNKHALGIGNLNL